MTSTQEKFPQQVKWTTLVKALGPKGASALRNKVERAKGKHSLSNGYPFVKWTRKQVEKFIKLANRDNQITIVRNMANPTKMYPVDVDLVKIHRNPRGRAGAKKKVLAPATEEKLL